MPQLKIEFFLFGQKVFNNGINTKILHCVSTKKLFKNYENSVFSYHTRIRRQISELKIQDFLVKFIKKSLLYFLTKLTIELAKRSLKIFIEES